MIIIIIHFSDCNGDVVIQHIIMIINSRRACAARVTVVVLCVCLCVCLSATILALHATRRLMNDTNSFSATRAR